MLRRGWRPARRCNGIMPAVEITSHLAPGLSLLLMFFSFDGIDGVGKSTQLRLFAEWLQGQGRATVVCRDPGSTPLGERVRQLLLESDESLRSACMIVFASRSKA